MGYLSGMPLAKVWCGQEGNKSGDDRFQTKHFHCCMPSCWANPKNTWTTCPGVVCALYTRVVCVQLVFLYRAKANQKYSSQPQGLQKCIGEGVKNMHTKNIQKLDNPPVLSNRIPTARISRINSFIVEKMNTKSIGCSQLLSGRTNIIFSRKFDSCVGGEMNMAWGRYMQRRWPNVAANSALSWSFRARPSLVACQD